MQVERVQLHAMAYANSANGQIRMAPQPGKRLVKADGSGRIGSTSALVDFKTAGVLLGLTVPQLRGLVKRGELQRAPAHGCKKFFFSRAALLRWAEANYEPRMEPMAASEGKSK